MGKGRDKRYILTTPFPQASELNLLLFLHVMWTNPDNTGKNASIKSKKINQSLPLPLPTPPIPQLSLYVTATASLVWTLGELYLYIYVQVCTYANMWCFSLCVFYVNGNILNLFSTFIFHPNIF